MELLEIKVTVINMYDGDPIAMPETRSDLDLYLFAILDRMYISEVELSC